MIDTEPLTISQACKRLGWSGDRPSRKLLDHVREREKALGIKILTSRTGKKNKRVRWYVTMRMLRKHFPEWFALSPVELKKAFDALEATVKKQMIARLETLHDARATDLEIKFQNAKDSLNNANNLAELALKKVDRLAAKLGHSWPY
jgi:molybdenum-dependent DNA-binding transcriptional regulator ModE